MNTQKENAPSQAHLHLHAVHSVNIGRIFQEQRVALMLHCYAVGGGLENQFQTYGSDGLPPDKEEYIIKTPRIGAAV